MLVTFLSSGILMTNDASLTSSAPTARPISVTPLYPTGKSITGTSSAPPGKTCDSCGMLNHFTSVCRQKLRPANRIGNFYAKMPDDSTVTFPPTIGHIRRARTTRNPFGPARQPMSRPTPTRKVVILNSKKPNHVITG